MSDSPEISAQAMGSSPLPGRDVMKEDFGWEVPVETVPVPSQGKVYPGTSPLCNRETIDIYAMTAKQEDILTSRALIKKGRVISELIKSCIVDRDVDPGSMLLGDRNALMIAIRITGYGSGYNAEVSCPACSQKSSHTFKLTDLPIKRLEIDPVTIGENLFSFTLPVTKKEVKFKFLTGNDERELSIIAERKRKAMPDLEVDNVVTSRLGASIVSIDGVEDRSKISMFINRMPALDSRKLRTYIDNHEPGVSMATWMSCPHCGENEEVSLPMGASFFWPAT